VHTITHMFHKQHVVRLQVGATVVAVILDDSRPAKHLSHVVTLLDCIDMSEDTVQGNEVAVLEVVVFSSSWCVCVCVCVCVCARARACVCVCVCACV